MLQLFPKAVENINFSVTRLHMLEVTFDFRYDRMFTSCHHKRPSQAYLGCLSLFLAVSQPLIRICTKPCGSKWLPLYLLYLLLRLQPLIMPRTGG